jgi:hypothetical protein
MKGRRFAPLTEDAFWRVVEDTYPEWLCSTGVSVVLSHTITEWEEAGSAVVRVVFETEELEDNPFEAEDEEDCDEPADGEAEDSGQPSPMCKNRFLCLMAFDFEGGGGWHIDDYEIQIEV